MIISWKWPLYETEKDLPDYLYIGTNSPLEYLDVIKQFKPDIIHGHYLDNAETFLQMAQILNVGFTLRTHSFDMLSGDITKYKKYVNDPKCYGIFVFVPFKQKCLNAGFDESKIFTCWPSININIFRNVFGMSNGPDIMSGGAFLPKKNIEGFILLAKKIKEKFPTKKISYYSVEESPSYCKSIHRFNKKNGNPVEFKTVQHSNMPYEYKKHQWLIYSGCSKLKTVGHPLMVAEAQACGVGVVMYKLRDDLQDYVTDNGYLYLNDGEVIDIIGGTFDSDKKIGAHNLSTRYDIATNIDQLSNMFKF
jgi:glycosyltransferase involved in cell wall biosynthesis